MLKYTLFMAETLLPSVAFDGTNVRMWPERTFSKSMHLPHKAAKPIIRQAAETEITNQITLEADIAGIPADVVLKQGGRWSEHTFTRDDQDWLEVRFTTRSFMWIKDGKLSNSGFPEKRKLATWSGGPRDGQEIVARNGEIVWDGPLGVLVHDQLVVWRDVGDGARAAWALMTPEQRSEFRHEIEDDAGVLVSHDAEIASPPPPYTEVVPDPDSPLAAIVY